MEANILQAREHYMNELRRSKKRDMLNDIRIREAQKRADQLVKAGLLTQQQAQTTVDLSEQVHVF